MTERNEIAIEEDQEVIRDDMAVQKAKLRLTLRNLIEANQQAIVNTYVHVLHAHQEPSRPTSQLDQRKIVKKILKGLLSYLEEPNQDHLRLEVSSFADQVSDDQQVSRVLQILNLGRNVLIEYVHGSIFSSEEEKEAILIIQDFFTEVNDHCLKKMLKRKQSDIHDRDQFIQEMHQDRLAMLGQVASSFVHEFRNPLTSIRGFVSLIEKENEGDEQSKQYFSIIHKEMKVLEHIVNQLLLLSEGSAFEDQVVLFHLKPVFEEVIQFLQPRFHDENIQVDLEVEDGLFCMGIKSQIKQVMTNIINNAAEELSRSDRRNARLIKIQARKEDHILHLCIANNGPPIPSHLIKNIFQPFITTKELGIGLGLSVCKKVIEKHQGNIRVVSNQEWTTFHIRFPYRDERDSGIIED